MSSNGFGNYGPGVLHQQYHKSSPNTSYSFLGCQPRHFAPQNPSHLASIPRTRPSIPDLRLGEDLSNDTSSLSLKPPSCPLCRGNYNYTAYFHNQKVFHSPPHHILRLVEKSYILKNTLQSLLITFVLHQFELEYLQDVKKMIRAWNDNVDALVNEVVDSAHGFQVELGPLGDVKTWTKGVMMQIWDHATGVRQMELEPGRWGVLVLEFRKLWEKVWLGYLKDQETEHFESGIQDSEI